MPGSPVTTRQSRRPPACGRAARAGTVLAALLLGACGDTGGGLDALTGFFSSEQRELDEEQKRISAELTTLPDLALGQQGERLGWHGRLVAAPHVQRTPAETGDVPEPAPEPPRPPRRARSIRIDLGQPQRISSIVMVPVDLASGSGPGTGPGYGFPVRFRLEASEDANFSEPVHVSPLEYGAVEFPNPQKFPVVFSRQDLIARYVRLTIISPFAGAGQKPVALGELMVLQGNRNIAGGLPRSAIEHSRNDSDESPPQWGIEGLLDGQSMLGAPTGISASGTEGYQSEPVKRPDTVKWVQVDLGEERELSEIRLIPAWSGDLPSRRGYGFPKRWKVETSFSSGFSQPSVVADFTADDYPNPAENPVTVRAEGHRARFVRFTATRLNERDDDYVLALAEMQVYSGDENVARGAAAQASDQRDSGIWQLKYLTDGMGSQRNLIEWPQYFNLLERRRQIEARLLEISTRRPEVAAAVLRKVLLWSGGLVLLAAMGTVTGIWRHRQIRRRELQSLRQRISQDVHDEIGAGLGTIKLLGQMGSADEERDELTRTEFAEIAGIARDIGESLRDIVWLIRPDNRTAGDLARRLKDTATTMLSGMKQEFTADMEDLAHDLPLEFKRQVILFFKEALHNMLKHSGAKHARVHIDGDDRYFLLTIEDDGRGFDPAERSSGAGLSGMRQRAATLNGNLAIESAPGKGTRLRLETPWP